MDDALWFICGTVPIIWLIRHKLGPDPWPGPWPWLTLLAGGLGGLGAVAVFGPRFAADSGIIANFLIAVSGGAFLGQVANLAFGSRGVTRT
jgi:hypothetical protein